MPMILSPTEAAIAIGAKCGGSAPSNDDVPLGNILQTLTSRLAAAMNVDSLTWGTYTDRFYIPSCMVRGEEHRVRLSNAYLDIDSFTLRDEDGAALATPGPLAFDAKYGIVEVTKLDKGYHSFEYDAGFKVEDDIYLGVPDWMKGVVIALLVMWYRTTVLTIRTPKDVRLVDVMQGLQRELTTRVYESYQRPRVNLIWSDAR